MKQKYLNLGSLQIGSLLSCDKDYLRGVTINGSLDLSSSIQSCPKDFLKGTRINLKRLPFGYNADLDDCLFDGTVSSKVKSVGLLPMLEKIMAYGVEKVKSLINFLGK